MSSPSVQALSASERWAKTSEGLNQGLYSQEYLHIFPQQVEGCCLQDLWLPKPQAEEGLQEIEPD